MLVLTRKAGQCVTIGQNISVKVLSIKGNQVKISIEAPKNILIYRDDIKHIIKEPKEQDEQAKDGTSFQEGIL